MKWSFINTITVQVTLSLSSSPFSPDKLGLTFIAKKHLTHYYVKVCNIPLIILAFKINVWNWHISDVT